MILNKKPGVFLAMGVIMIIGMAATENPKDQTGRRKLPAKADPGWQNLKIIPRNTDEDQMERIMHRYSSALGVTCSYCHPDSKPGIFPMRVDFVSDDKPEKNISRNMMRMTAKINRKYFDYTDRYDFDGLSKSVISCNTCHRGLPKPSNISLAIP